MSTIIYSKNHCPYCDMAKKLLDEKNISYKEININLADQPDQILEEIRKITDAKTFPQIILNDQYIGGYTDLRDFFYNSEKK